MSDLQASLEVLNGAARCPICNQRPEVEFEEFYQAIARPIIPELLVYYPRLTLFLLIRLECAGHYTIVRVIDKLDAKLMAIRDNNDVYAEEAKAMRAEWDEGMKKIRHYERENHDFKGNA